MDHIIIFESSKVVQKDEGHGSASACTIDKKKYSSLRRLLRVIVHCLKLIKIKVWNRCKTELKNDTEY